MRDVRYAFRILLKSPGFTAVAVLTLAAGIGSNAAIFSIVNAILLRPPSGVASPDGLVLVGRTMHGAGFNTFGYPDYVDYCEHSRSFAELVAYDAIPLSLSGDYTARVRGAAVSGNYFLALGVKASIGRTLAPEDDRNPGEHPVAVISDRLWRRGFGSSPAAVGRTLRINGYTFTIIGVTPPGFTGTDLTEPLDLWLPMMMQEQARPATSGYPNLLTMRGAVFLRIFGRLRPGVTLEQAREELRVITAQMVSLYPDSHRGRSVALAAGLGLDPSDRLEAKQLSTLLLAIVGLLLVVACANVASLLLSRAAARRREIAVRLALGASRASLVRQLLTESVLLCLIAGGAGLLVAPWTTDLIASFQPPIREVDFTPDARVLGFTLALSLFTAILFGLAPALRATRADLTPGLRDATPGAGRRSTRLRSTLVVAQVALSLVVLVTAGLLVRTVRHLMTGERGFDSRNVVLFSLDPGLQGYPAGQGRLLYDQVFERVQVLPGVESAALARTVPTTGSTGVRRVFLEGEKPLNGDPGTRVDFNIVTPGYFGHMGIPISKGRDFTRQDREGAPRVAIVSETFARRMWPRASDPTGQRIGLPRPGGMDWLEVIGVAGDIKYRSLLVDPPLVYYVPLAQSYDARMTLQVRSTRATEDLVATVDRAIHAFDPAIPLYDVRTLDDHMAQSLWQQRMVAALVGGFGLVAALLAGIWIFGVLADAVAQRTQEIGLRMALGARVGDVLTMVLGQGMRLTVIGLALGLAAALATTRLAASFLYGVGSTDLPAYLGAFVLLGVIALAASYLPALRATRVDPAIALRYE